MLDPMEQTLPRISKLGKNTGTSSHPYEKLQVLAEQMELPSKGLIHKNHHQMVLK